MKYNLPVEGMTCASCVARVEKVLKNIEGIENVSVNFANEKVTFELKNNAKLKTAKESVEKYGYKLNTKLLLAENISISEREQTDEHYEKLKKDLIFSAILTFPIFFISMFREFEWFTSMWSFDEVFTNKILLILTTPVIFISGKRFFKVFWVNLKHFSFEMNSLVAIGTGTAYSYSVVATLFPNWLTAGNNLPHVYFETASVIILLITMGKLLEVNAKKKTSGAIRKLLELKPKEVTILKNGVEKRVGLSLLKIGDLVIIKPGEKIPADGIVKIGKSFVDESMLTGESIPVEKNIGAEVIGGSINKNGSFNFEISALGDKSTLGQIIKLVQDAQGSKAPIQNLADKVSSVFVPAVIILAIITFIAWMFYAETNNLNVALINFVAVLIIACPCALGLATPTAIIVGIGKGAQKGILIKNGESLEIAYKIDTVVFDKTGTITDGVPTVTDVITTDISEHEMLSIVTSIEKKSEHPIAIAIIDHSNKLKLDYTEPVGFQSITGLGLSAIINNKTVLIGNTKQMEQNQIDIKELIFEYDRLSKEGKTTIFCAINGKLKGLISVEDSIKDSSFEAIEKIKNYGLKVIMLTGDNSKTAEAIAMRIGINNVFADILPQQKVELIKDLQSQGKTVAMVGDGINDSPALATADLGIAIGTGSDIAIESSDITLVKGDLNSVAAAINLSRKTIQTIKQNLFWAFIYNIIGIPLAIFGLLNPMIGALAMSFSSVSVISNSLRLKRVSL